MSRKDRVERIKRFAEFQENGRIIFQQFSDEDKKYSHFKVTHMLNICPKGRCGGINDSLFEVFYGSSIIGVEKKIDVNFREADQFNTETGATLSFQLTDTGYVMIWIYPPHTDKMRPIEDAICYEEHLHPAKLTPTFLKKCWNAFNIYMENYSVDGNPSFVEKVRLWRLKFFKHLIINNIYQDRKITTSFKQIAHYVLTVGLSGFLIWLFTIYPQNKNIQPDNSYKTELEEQLRRYIGSCDANIGVAIIANDRDTIVINDGRFQLNSVVKLYQAAALAIASPTEINITDSVEVDTKFLDHNTWSPMLDSIQSPIKMSLYDLLKWSLKYSDNNASDIISEHYITPEKVDSVLKTKGYNDLSVKWTEKEMHQDPSRSNGNWSSPLAAAKLINQEYQSWLHSSQSLNSHIATILAQCETGEKRLPRPLKTGNHIIAHKTGTGFLDTNGHPQGINDVGYVILNNGQHYSIAVFIESSRKNSEETENMIGDISEIVLNQILKN